MQKVILRVIVEKIAHHVAVARRAFNDLTHLDKSKLSPQNLSLEIDYNLIAANALLSAISLDLAPKTSE